MGICGSKKDKKGKKKGKGKKGEHENAFRSGPAKDLKKSHHGSRKTSKKDIE